MEKASKLTKEQIDYLLHNENVAGVTEKNIFFTVEFKEKFYALYKVFGNKEKPKLPDILI